MDCKVRITLFISKFSFAFLFTTSVQNH